MPFNAGQVLGATALNNDFTGKLSVSQRGVPNGVAPLDASGKLPSANLTAHQHSVGDITGLLDGGGKLIASLFPPLAITSVYVVASEAAQLSLTSQEGDVAVRTDINKSFVRNSGVAGTMADWTELLTPTNAVLSVAGLTGAISAGSLKAQLALTVSDISNLQAALDAKAGLNVVQTFTRTQVAQSRTISSGVAWDADLGNIVRATPNGSTFTIANPTNLSANEAFLLVISYTTSHGVTFGANYTNVATIPLTATAGAIDVLGFYSDNGTHLRCTGFMLNVGQA